MTPMVIPSEHHVSIVVVSLSSLTDQLFDCLIPSSRFETRAECGWGDLGFGEALQAAVSQWHWHTAYRLHPIQPQQQGGKKGTAGGGGHLSRLSRLQDFWRKQLSLPCKKQPTQAGCVRNGATSTLNQHYRCVGCSKDATLLEETVWLVWCVISLQSRYQNRCWRSSPASSRRGRMWLWCALFREAPCPSASHGTTSTQGTPSPLRPPRLWKHPTQSLTLEESIKESTSARALTRPTKPNQVIQSLSEVCFIHSCIAEFSLTRDLHFRVNAMDFRDLVLLGSRERSLLIFNLLWKWWAVRVELSIY